MKRRSILFLLLISSFSSAFSQIASASASSGSAMASSRSEAVSVNGYTGIPSISFPLINYSHRSGLSLNLGLSYFAGGLKTEEAPTAFGAGWALAGTGAITRRVRGLPDDCPGRGFLYMVPLTDYSRDSIGNFGTLLKDGEQDVFQIQCPGYSGKFYIGKNNSIVVSPASKIRIQPLFNDIDSMGLYHLLCTLNGFKVTVENGTSYYFSEKEYQVMTSRVMDTVPYPDYINTEVKYASCWYLTKIEAFTAADTIGLHYVSAVSNIASPIYQTYRPPTMGETHHDQYGGDIITSEIKILSRIDLPDSKKIDFVYNVAGQKLYDTIPLINRIKFSDPDFLYGYMFSWDTSSAGKILTNKNFLRKVDWYNTHVKKNGYEFAYNDSFPSVASHGLVSYKNSKDHWGYYNSAWNDDEYIPTIPPNYYTGADRIPNCYAIAGSLSSVKDTKGGTTFYDFENNTILPYKDSMVDFSFNPSTLTTNTISINRLVGQKTFFILDGVDGASSGSEKIRLYVTNTAGSITYFSDTIDMKGRLNFGFIKTKGIALPSGTYSLKIEPLPGYYPASFTYNGNYNTQVALTGNDLISAGIRIKRIRHYDAFSGKYDTLSTFSYRREDGKSSGMLGVPPNYRYVLRGAGVTRSAISDGIDYSDGTNVGYSRVTVFQGSETRNLGSVVTEYSSMDDYDDFDNSPPRYPYMPARSRSYMEGLEKRKLVYDNTQRLVKSTTNSFSLVDVSVADSNFYSVRSAAINAETLPDPGIATDFTGSVYRPLSGTVQLTASRDTMFHPDTSFTVTEQIMEYDTNYNLKKTTVPYDINRGLFLEKRIYYPYDYTVNTRIIKMLRDNKIFVPVSAESWITGDLNPRMISCSLTDFYDLAESTGYLGRNPKFPVQPGYLYSLETVQPVPESTIGLQDSTLFNRDTLRILPQEKIIYDYNLPVQVTNVQSGISQSTVYGYSDKKPIAKISNAAFKDIAYTSFEDETTNTWEHSGPKLTKNFGGIMGIWTADLSGDTLFKKGLDPAKKYLVSYWGVSTIAVSGPGSVNLIEDRNSWHLYNKIITGDTIVRITGSGLLDELRLQPVEASMTTTTYNQMGQVTAVADDNHNIQYYSYDEVNRPVLIFDKDYNISKKFSYSDTVTHIDLTPDWQDSGDSTLWVCGSGGMVMHLIIDMNPYSETYLGTRYEAGHYDCDRCPPPSCAVSPWQKIVSCACERACKVTTACFRVRGQWFCTYHYVFSDSSESEEFEEECESCQVGTNCNF